MMGNLSAVNRTPRCSGWETQLLTRNRGVGTLPGGSCCLAGSRARGPLALDGDPAKDAFPFGLMADATLIFVALWNVATLDRQSEYPEGRWLTAVSVLAIATGLAGTLSSLWPLGLFLAAGGAVGLLGRTRGG